MVFANQNEHLGHSPFDCAAIRSLLICLLFHINCRCERRSKRVVSLSLKCKSRAVIGSFVMFTVRANLNASVSSF